MSGQGSPAGSPPLAHTVLKSFAYFFALNFLGAIAYDIHLVRSSPRMPNVPAHQIVEMNNHGGIYYVTPLQNHLFLFWLLGSAGGFIVLAIVARRFFGLKRQTRVGAELLIWLCPAIAVAIYMFWPLPR